MIDCSGLLLQQAVSQQLMTRFEFEFSDYSSGFRPKKNMQHALLQSLAYINEGYIDIVNKDFIYPSSDEMLVS